MSVTPFRDQTVLKDYMNVFLYYFSWMLLIFLGYVSCVGVMFITMESYKVDLMFSMLFMVVIFMFLYLVADMDTPMHGLIKVNVKGNFDCLIAMENCYTDLQ